jgi:hypothetical protein
MQRVRIGLTGLGFVFVAVLLATALTGTPEDEAPVTGNGAATSVNEQADRPKEPLAELGVTPGHADNKAAPPANQAAPASR